MPKPRGWGRADGSTITPGRLRATASGTTLIVGPVSTSAAPFAARMFSSTRRRSARGIGRALRVVTVPVTRGSSV